MNHAIEFIETSKFTRQIQAIEISMELGNQGKSGSARIIYFLATALILEREGQFNVR